MKLLLLDNYDSFTFNLVHLLRDVGVSNLDVHRNDKVSLEAVGEYDRIVLSPGPGIPSEAGIMPEVVKRYAATHSILGVCLGHQCIGEVFGGRLINMGQVCHGQGLQTKVEKSSDPLFHGIPKTFLSGRYHSWLVSSDDFPPCLEILATDEEGRIMAVRHREYRIRGVQFHPESILTQYGREMMTNWLKI
jgi:anthranilate synthase component II